MPDRFEIAQHMMLSSTSTTWHCLESLPTPDDLRCNRYRLVSDSPRLLKAYTLRMVSRDSPYPSIRFALYLLLSLCISRNSKAVSIVSTCPTTLGCRGFSHPETGINVSSILSALLVYSPLRLVALRTSPHGQYAWLIQSMAAS